MLKRQLLILLLALSSPLTILAQDPGVGGFVVTSPLATGIDGTVKVNILNGSSTPIPQANNATWTINLPPNIGVIGGSAGVSLSPAAANITIAATTYSPATGTTVTLTSDQGAVPGNASYTITINVRGVQPGTDAPISISASSNPPVFTNSTGNDNANTTITVTGPLPVALVSFTAQAQANHTVALAWTTSLETANKGFVVERSKNLITFETVGEVVDVAPMSNALKTYHLLDQTPYMGTSYYRLTQLDLSGKMTGFPVVSVVLRDETYGVFPNPVTSESGFTVRLDEPETAKLSFYTTQGWSLSLEKLGIQSGNLLLRSGGPLSAGVYVLTVEERGQTRQHRIVVESTK